MTTDITILVQRLKVAAKNGCCHTLFPDDCQALVEALEKAKQRIDELENDEVRQRLANAEHQLYMAELAKNNLRASRKAQLRRLKAAEQQIAEIESRTVKMPPCVDDLHGIGMVMSVDAVVEALTAAGIKVEAE